MLALRMAVGILSATLVLLVISSAMRTVVLPRGEPVRLSRLLFRTTRAGFNILLRTRRTFETRDRLMAHYAPVTLLLLPLTWLVVASAGFTGLFWTIEQDGWLDAFATAGSSLVTLGFERPDGVAALTVSFAAGAVEITILALLLVTYLPSIYAAFSERETAVSLFEVRAGTPPSVVEMMVRYHTIRGFAATDEIWPDWEIWFARIAESHVSLPSLVFFRSPDPRMSWVTAAGAVLDAAAMMCAVIDVEHLDNPPAHVRRPDGELTVPLAATCIRAGYLALRRVAGAQGVEVAHDPAPHDPISVTREEFDQALDEMAAAGVPLRADRDRMWRDWAGWRVNYDAALLGLAELTVAPRAPWSSDRVAGTMSVRAIRRRRRASSSG